VRGFTAVGELKTFAGEDCSQRAVGKVSFEIRGGKTRAFRLLTGYVRLRQRCTF
jgi:hypothetical protein